MADTETNKDARMWGMFSHLSALAGYVVPLGWIVGPLVVWLIKKEEMPFVDDQGKESLNFQISVLIVTTLCGVLFFLVIPIIIGICVFLASIVFVIIAAINANNGVYYRYPVTFRFLK